MAKVIVIGLYGCYCHPFKNWQDLKNHEKQKFSPGDTVKHRCTGKSGKIIGKTTEIIYPIDKPKYTVESKSYKIRYGPLQSDIENIFPQNAIRINKIKIKSQQHE